jgi:L-methionine (R)-S-oxide reductase
MKIDYATLAETLQSLTHGETDAVALMATVTCEVHHSDDRFDWTGFYRVTEPELLKIGPYQGGHGCLVIPFSRGVCGAAARTGQTLVQALPVQNWSCRYGAAPVI